MRPKVEFEIQNEVGALLELKPRVPRRDAYGFDNHAAIDAQLQVLRFQMTVERANEVYGDDEHLREHADDAARWLLGRINGRLFDDWAAEAALPKEGATR